MDANEHTVADAAGKESPAAKKTSLKQHGLAGLSRLFMAGPERVLTFEELYCEESRKLGKPLEMKKGWVAAGTGGEPWVNFTPRDRFGIALSGGGIRSATFNLGLLQALDQLGVLKHVDYLATVSGGGYVGGFWTAWLRRNETRPDGKKFPVADGPGGGESAEVRHLREFSRFLLPRIQVLGTEFWGIVMTVLGGALPSFVSALTVLALLWFGWVMLLAGLLAEELKIWRVWAVLILLCGNFIISEIPWKQIWRGQSGGRNEFDWRDCAGYVAGAALGCALIVAGWLWWREIIHPGFASSVHHHDVKLQGFATLADSVLAFEPALLILSVALLLFIIRVPLVRWLGCPEGLPYLSGVERAVTRVLRLAAGLLAMAALWWLAGTIEKGTTQFLSLKYAGGGTAVSTGLFLWARKWLAEPPKETNGGNLLTLAVTWLKRATPKVLALITWVLLFVLVGVGVQWWLQAWIPPHETNRDLIFLALPVGCLLLVGLMIVFFDPGRMGMHELYRSRISRCYLGASNPDGDGSWLFSADDFIDLPSLADKLNTPADGVSVWLAGKLSAATLQSIKPDQSPEPDPFELQIQFAQELNALLGGPLIYDAARFNGVALRHETQKLLSQNPQKEVCARLNRLLLEDAYPREISRNHAVSAAERAAANRTTKERVHDDLTLAELDHVNRPLHLVCATANDLSGEPVGTLYRGAKSAVLSVHGISLGNQTARLDDLRYSSAITASAAAFNSQMGRISMGLGPAVTFLMSALNLRLGLWVPHPANCGSSRLRLPGRFFFLELLGLSSTNDGHLLLSDGGHFENFGLYELIRRHCRYIIVSDCGADPEVAFDDLANVLRRVREDFGVEVEVDVSRLHPGENGLASQHAVVGTIHYNGLGGMDKGTILFIKPSLTGDEPPDVLQYQTRNPTFPQESTANQFYDEPQWESYRRLGEHVGRTVLAFLDRPETKVVDTVDRIFMEARSFWYPMPENLNGQFIDMSARCAELEENLTSEGPLMLRSEFFSEAGELSPPEAVAGAEAGADAKSSPAAVREEELKVLGFLIRIIQIMEDVWVSGDLERYWSHPLNEGWMNYFHRWAGTPSFRRWWPVLAPIYSLGFRSFVQERFAVGTIDEKEDHSGRPFDPSAQLNFSLLAAGQNHEHSQAWHSFMQHHPEVQPALPGKKIFGYELKLLNRDGVSHDSGLWVGFVVVAESLGQAPKTAQWRAEDFFVPPMLHGGGFVSKLLDALIRYYQDLPNRRIIKLQVNFDDRLAENSKASPARKSQGLAPAARYDRVREIEFYKSRGFQYHQREHPRTGAISLHLRLEAKKRVQPMVPKIS